MHKRIIAVTPTPVADSFKFTNLEESNMNRKLIAPFAIAVCLAWSPVAKSEGDKKEPSARPALGRFAELAGEWTGKGMHGDAEHDARVVYKVTSGGTAVVETIDPGGEHE